MPNDPGFELWLDRQLRQHADRRSGPSPLAAQARYLAADLQGGVRLPLLMKVGAALTMKTTIAFAAGALAVGAAGAGETAVTGSVNPSDWGKQVVMQVNECKAALAPGSHGIGQCVSSFASSHAKSARAEHRPAATPTHGAHGPDPPKGKQVAAPRPRADGPAHAHSPQRKTGKQGRNPQLATGEHKQGRNALLAMSEQKGGDGK